MLTKKRIKIFLLFVMIFLVFSVLPTTVFSATKTNPPKYTSIFYYRDGKLAKESLFNYPSYIDVLAPQSYSFDDSGKLAGHIDDDILNFTKEKKIKVMPLVTNKNFGEKEYKNILDNPDLQTSAINSLVDEAKKNNYWGWQFNFEQMDVSYRDKFSAFIKKAADAMKKDNLIISVAVVAQVSENPKDYKNDLWQKLIGVYDYSSLASNTDFVSVMAYDDPESKGPVTQYSWLKRVLTHSLKYIPAEKLSLGIPLYYWHWNDATGKLIGIGGREGIYSAFKKHYISTHYSTKHEAPYLTYWSYNKEYVIWYENARSIKKKVELIKRYNLHGFSAWALGLELPSIYEAIK